MGVFRPGVWLPTIAGVLVTASVLSAATVMQMNLAEMVQRADRIYRGTVVSATAGSLAVGGGQLPVVSYRLRVEEVFRGSFEEVKGVRFAEIRMLGKFAPVRHGSLRWSSPLPKMPDMNVGGTYLVLTTQPSEVGLSTTVGLGQGCFRIAGVGKDETAVNELDNSGLFRDMVPPASIRTNTLRRSIPTSAAPSGPLAYTELSSRINALVGR
jgi:hypothetical protein